MRRSRAALASGLTLGLVGSLALAALPARAAQVSVAVGEPLQRAVDAARPGDVLVLAPGIHRGPVRVVKSVTLQGPGATIDGGGVGQVVVLSAPGARIDGLTIRESGDDIGAPDACVFIEAAATDAVVRGCRLERCAFGVWVHETRGATIEDNTVESREEMRESDRGNGIHLFNASQLIVRGNTVRRARDGIYVSATEDSLIEGNRAEQLRFGIHYMYSYRNRVLANETHDSKIGIALMESRDLVVEDNVASGNTREGLLFRDVLESEIRRNRLSENGTGMFFYSSTENTIEANEIVDNELGLKVWAGSRRNRMQANVIRGNREQVFYVGAEDQRWGESGRGNYWGDYIGWDQDGDGVGDRPHRVDSFTASLLYRYPSAVLLLRSPALETLAHLADRLTLLRTPTIIDVAPLMLGATP